MDDLAKYVDRLVRINFASRVSQIDGALDAIAKTKLLREFDRQVARGKNMATGANSLDQVAAIMREHLRLHCSHNIGAAQIDLLRCCWSFG